MTVTSHTQRHVAKTSRRETTPVQNIARAVEEKTRLILTRSATMIIWWLHNPSTTVLEVVDLILLRGQTLVEPAIQFQKLPEAADLRALCIDLLRRFRRRRLKLLFEVAHAERQPIDRPGQQPSAAKPASGKAQHRHDVADAECPVDGERYVRH